MSRLHLIIWSLFISIFSFSQNELKQYLKFADENMAKGDYYYAIEYYEKAMELDSATVDIQWRYAEALRAYKDYPKAAYYYKKIYRKEYAKLYPRSVLNLALMLKQQGKYDEAIEFFKEAKKRYAKDRRGYLYRKVKQELVSCLYAKNAITDSSDLILEKLPLGINTKNSEFPHNMVNNQLIYSSLRAETDSLTEEVYDTKYQTKLYIGDIDSALSQKIKDLDLTDYNVGNGSFNLDSSKYYFSVCKEDGFQYKCKIWVADFDGDNWKNLDSLGDVINQPGTNTTMPFYTKFDTQEVLIFASDREGGVGGMDLWYARVKDGNQFVKIKNIGKRINTMDNELSPFYDEEEGVLYFSSSWHAGFGGYDIFKSTRSGYAFGEVTNVGVPINSPGNDLYYFKVGDQSYFSSNRIGVYYSKNPTCCSDIFSAHPPIIIEEPDDPQEDLRQLMKRLPVTLYFHNDVPNPRSWDTTTNLNYLTTYNEYTDMKEKYESEYAKGLRGEKASEAKEDIGDFFIEYVDQGVRDLRKFTTLLVKELDKGRKIELTVKGFASPLAKTDYNVNLTQRRIASLENYLMEYQDGALSKYLLDTASNGGRLSIARVPFGEYTAEKFISDNPNDAKNSIYSRVAARERKIEIQSVSFLSDSVENSIQIEKQIHDFGTVGQADTLRTVFKIRNSGTKPIVLSEVKSNCECVSGKIMNSTLAPGQSTEVYYELIPKNYSGKLIKSIYVESDNGEEIRLIGSAEVREN